jgi:N-acetylneuraminic acid mutarotase
MTLLAINPPSAHGPLSLSARIAAQRAIEQVYWQHRIWPTENTQPKPPLKKVMPDSKIQAKVEEALRKSNALQTYWQRPINGEQLQAEINRMVHDSKAPDVLREQFAALGNDPHLIAEIIARPILADRLIGDFYSSDARFHGAVKAQAEAALKNFNGDSPSHSFGVASIAQLKNLGGQYREMELGKNGPASDSVSTAHGLAGKANSINLDAAGWNAAINHLATSFTVGTTSLASTGLPIGQLSTLQEDSNRFYVTAVLSKTADSVKVAEVSWNKVPFEQWWAGAKNGEATTISEPSSIYNLPTSTSNLTSKSASNASALNSTSQPYSTSPLSVADDTWKPTKEPLVQGRTVHSAVWTGAEMVVWAGFPITTGGGRYNPSTDSWIPTTRVNAPSWRYRASMVWTGTEVIVWGGNDPNTFLNDGARYSPASDSWTPVSNESGLAPRTAHVAIWTGSEMIIWGGGGLPNTVLADGARYKPSTNTWQPVSTTQAPAARALASAVWTGSEMIVWGGNGCSSAQCPPFNPLSDGGRYNPLTDSWTPVPAIPGITPGARLGHTAVWTGTEMIVWGGLGCDSAVLASQCGSSSSFTETYRADGGRYNPNQNPLTAWTSISTTNGPGARFLHTAIWTGSKMVVWGGEGAEIFNTGAQYDPANDTWLSISTSNAPSARYFHTAIWTGSEMIIWGGQDCDLCVPAGLNTGGRYNPQSDSWVATAVPPDFNTPFARYSHSAVWTGAEVIIWGGLGTTDAFFLETNTGALYDPATDSWKPTSAAGGIDARWLHTAVWTGTEMIIWGGLNCTGDRSSVSCNSINTGGKYNPSSDTWIPVTTENAPLARDLHSAVWTGTEMIAWGGENSGSGSYLNTGGRYNPSSDQWIPTATTNAPGARDLHTAVWTGNEMIVWGGFGKPCPVIRFEDYNDGGRYNPVTNTWIPINIAGAPIQRHSHSAIWTGSKMVVWGGDEITCSSESLGNDGGIYDPSSDTWTPTNLTQAPAARVDFSAVWTGSEMIVWGGLTDLSSFSSTNSGGRYNPVSNTWQPTTPLNAPAARYQHGAIWTGSDMIVWGGESFTLTGGLYHAVSQAPQILSAVSRKTHGTAGTFDVDLPLTGAPGIECRSGGTIGDHQVVITFGAPISNVSSATVTTGSSGTGSVAGTPTVNGNQVTVDLTSVSNAQTITINLIGVSDGTNTGNVSIPMAILLGDVNQSRRVDAADVSLVRQQTLQTVNTSNFREDVNASGRIDAADVSVVRQQTLTSLP